MSSRLFLVVAFAAFLSGCAEQRGLNWPAEQGASSRTAQQSHPISNTVMVPMLLPLSGSNSALGESLLQAAQMAVTDLNEPSIQLKPIDTKGTPEGAKQAAIEASQMKAPIIIGPVFGNEVSAIKPIINASMATSLTFSTDWRQLGGNVISLGILPFDQAARMAVFAKTSGFKNVLVITGTDAYGDVVADAFTAKARSIGLPIAAEVKFGNNALSALSPSTLKSIDAVFVPLTGAPLNYTLKQLAANGLTKTQLLGTGLWDDPQTAGMPQMQNAVYAAPSPDARKNFETRYRATFGTSPQRIASLAYDAVALTVVSARQQSGFSRNQLTNPNGFIGIDGIFRLKGDGTNERGLAVLKIVGQSAQIIESAPASFQ